MRMLGSVPVTRPTEVHTPPSLAATAFLAFFLVTASAGAMTIASAMTALRPAVMRRLAFMEPILTASRGGSGYLLPSRQYSIVRGAA